MKKYLILSIFILPLIVFSVFIFDFSVFKSNAASPSDYGLKEGDLISAIFSDDPDVYIINEHGYKRLFLNPEIFKFYGHLGGFASVKLVTPEVRDAFSTVGLFRNCEKKDLKVYGFESDNEDEGQLRWVNTSGDQAIQDDPDFFKKVFCINDKEFKWYKRGEELKSVKEVVQYHRVTSTSSPQATPAIPAIPAIPATPAVPASTSQPFSPVTSVSQPLTPSITPITSTPASGSFSPKPAPIPTPVLPPPSPFLIHRLDGTNPWASRFGSQIATGDINGDGKTDIIVGDALADYNGNGNVEYNSGSVYIYSGADYSLLHRFDGNTYHEYLGFRVASGDINGDGKDDIVFSTEGKGTYVYSGADYRLLHYFDKGSANFTVGDVNGDGKGDIITASPMAASSGNGLTVYSGVSFGWLSQKSNASNTAVTAVGSADVNGDGKKDVLASVTNYSNSSFNCSNSQTYSRIVYVYAGDGSQLLKIDEPVARESFGSSMASAGDVNGDGKEDIIIGANGANRNGCESGSAYVYSGADGSLIRRFDGGAAGDSFGGSVATAGDVNRDGKADVIISAIMTNINGVENVGSVYIYSVVDGILLYRFDGEKALDWFGKRVLGGFDINGDGKVEVIVGTDLANKYKEYPAGRIYIYSPSSSTSVSQTAPVAQPAVPATPATPAQPAGSTPTPTPTLTSSPSPSPTASVSATPIPTPIPTPSPTPTANPTLSYIPISMVQMVYPNGGEYFEVGKTYTIRWSSQNIPSGSINHFQLSIYSVRPGLLDEVHLAIGSSSIPPDQTSYSWTVPNVAFFDSVKDPPTTSYKIVVYAFDNNNRTSNIRISSDYSDKAFTITSAGATPLPIPTPTVENCTDYDGLDPYTYGRLTYTQQNGYVNEAFDVCSSANASILLERACLGFDGFSGYVEYLCPNGCSNGVCNSASISQNSVNNFAVFSRNLSVGSRGSDVKQLQALLVNEVGYSADLITGYFGRITQNAVKKLQEKYGVKPASGYFGEITRKALRAFLSNQ